MLPVRPAPNATELLRKPRSWGLVGKSSGRVPTVGVLCYKRRCEIVKGRDETSGEGHGPRGGGAATSVLEKGGRGRRRATGVHVGNAICTHVASGDLQGYMTLRAPVAPRHTNRLPTLTKCACREPALMQ